MTLPLWQKVKRTKKPLDEGERGERKSWPKTQHSKNKSWDMVPSLHNKYMGNNGNSDRLYLLGFQNHCRC